LNLLWVLLSIIFYFQIIIGDNTKNGFTAADEAQPERGCLPINIHLTHADSRLILGNIGKWKLITQLLKIGAHCNGNDKLVDWNEKQIAFYYEPPCGGAQPLDPKTSQAIQQDEADKLNRLASYTVIHLPCFYFP